MTKFNDGSLRAAIDESIEASDQLLAVDAGLVAAARKVADRIDAAVETEDGAELTKALYLIPHVNNLLKEMLATPAARQAEGLKKEGESAKAVKLRALQGGQAGKRKA